MFQTVINKKESPIGTSREKMVKSVQKSEKKSIVEVKEEDNEFFDQKNDDESSFLVIDREEQMNERKFFSFPN